MQSVLSGDFCSSVLNVVADPIFVKDRAFNFVLVNDAFCELVALKREDLIGKTDYDFFPKEQADFFRKKDEEMFAKEVKVDVAEEPITVAGGEQHVLRTRKVPLRDSEGAVTHIVGIIHDITEIKKAEAALRTANDTLERRVEESTIELKRFAYSAFHELNAPSMAMIRLSEWLIEDTADHVDAEAREKLHLVNQRAHRLQQMVSDLSAYTQASVRREPTALDVRACATEVWRDLAVPETFTLRFSDPLESITADRATVMGVLNNLIANAVRHHDRTDGNVTVACRKKSDGVELEVADDGPGIEEAYLDKVFDLFFRLRTRDELEGTGLGLPLVKRVVSAVGGDVQLTSKVHEGTQVTITWPH